MYTGAFDGEQMMGSIYPVTNEISVAGLEKI
jgi:hypothetical protein